MVVFGYGGGLTDGNRDEYRFVGEAFASLGFVTVVYDYRLYPEVSFPTYSQDAALGAGVRAAPSDTRQCGDVS